MQEKSQQQQKSKRVEGSLILGMRHDSVILLEVRNEVGSQIWSLVVGINVMQKLFCTKQVNLQTENLEFFESCADLEQT